MLVANTVSKIKKMYQLSIFVSNKHKLESIMPSWQLTTPIPSSESRLSHRWPTVGGVIYQSARAKQ
jgi:hypothetical protein